MIVCELLHDKGILLITPEGPVRDHHRHIERVAAVTDSAFLKIAPSIARHFANPEIRVFASDESARAMTAGLCHRSRRISCPRP